MSSKLLLMSRYSINGTVKEAGRNEQTDLRQSVICKANPSILNFF